MNEEELREYCKKIMKEEYKQNLIDIMAEKETLRLINERLLKDIKEDYIPKSKLKQIQMECEYEQVDGKNICENRIKIKLIKELLGENKE